MSNYKLIQLTNSNIGDVAVDEYMPLGSTSRRLNASQPNCSTFTVSSTGSNILYLNDSGYYYVVYSTSLVAGAAGEVTISLVSNGTTLYSVTETATEGGTVNVTLPYAVRVCPNSCSVPTNCPAGLQLQLSGVAVTGGNSNLIVEKIQ